MKKYKIFSGCFRLVIDNESAVLYLNCDKEDPTNVMLVHSGVFKVWLESGVVEHLIDNIYNFKTLTFSVLTQTEPYIADMTEVEFDTGLENNFNYFIPNDIFNSWVYRNAVYPI